MPLPLYRLEEEHERERFILQHKGNTGLKFHKYFTHWNTGEWKIEPGAKFDWIKIMSQHPAGDKSLLTSAAERLVDLIDALQGEFHCYKTHWRFATGLGLQNPIENGMAWHHTLGVPYLPGSSLKGLVRAWVEQWLDTSPNEIARIFGARETDHDKDNQKSENDPAKGVGSIIFFDALPVEPVQLAADVMTPHYQKYYSGNEPPGDWQDPNPIPFLTVDADQVFLFAVAPRGKSKPENRSDLETVLRWMEEALANIGAGAKTATGYGRFIRCEKTESKLKSAIIQRKEDKTKQVSTIPAHLSGPIADEMLQDQYDEPERFMEALTNKWLVRMQAEETAAANRLTIAKLLKNWYQVHREGQWEKPNKKNTPKIEAIRKVLGE